jgi:hypothetical protein
MGAQVGRFFFNERFQSGFAVLHKFLNARQLQKELMIQFQSSFASNRNEDFALLYCFFAKDTDSITAFMVWCKLDFGTNLGNAAGIASAVVASAVGSSH